MIIKFPVIFLYLNTLEYGADFCEGIQTFNKAILETLSSPYLDIVQLNLMYVVYIDKAYSAYLLSIFRLHFMICASFWLSHPNRYDILI